MRPIANGRIKSVLSDLGVEVEMVGSPLIVLGAAERTNADDTAETVASALEYIVSALPLNTDSLNSLLSSAIVSSSESGPS